MAEGTYNQDLFTVHLSPPELQAVRDAVTADLDKTDAFLRDSAMQLDRSHHSDVSVDQTYEVMTIALLEARTLRRVLVVLSPAIVDGKFV